MAQPPPCSPSRRSYSSRVPELPLQVAAAVRERLTTGSDEGRLVGGISLRLLPTPIRCPLSRWLRVLTMPSGLLVLVAGDAVPAHRAARSSTSVVLIEWLLLAADGALPKHERTSQG